MFPIVLPLLGEEPSHLESEHSQAVGETHLSEVPQLAITIVRATDLTLGLPDLTPGLLRIPAGFYVRVQAGGTQWQTANKSVQVDQDLAEWNEQIVLPSELSGKVWFGVYATFELGPMLGHGDLLRTFEIPVAELLNHSENSHSITFQPKAGEIVSPCTALLITVEPVLSCGTVVGVLHPINPATPIDMRALILGTEAGHGALGQYHRTQDHGDLDESIKHFESVCELCPVDHPCRPAALFNLATAKFIGCQVNKISLDLDAPISLFQDALDLRLTGHPDRPATQLHLAVALLSRFEKRGFQTDADVAGKLLNEVLDVCNAKSHVYTSALLAAQMRMARSTHAPPIAPMHPSSSDELARRMEQASDMPALDEMISLHYGALKSYSMADARRRQLLCNLGNALQIRFNRQGNDQDLNEAISFHRESLSLLPFGHPDRFISLGNLACTLSIRFERRGNDEDLDEAIPLHREVLDLLLLGHPERVLALINLARALCDRFRRRGDNNSLDEAISLLRKALDLLPIGHPDRFIPLGNLAGALTTCFGHRGNDEYLDEAVPLHREVLDLLSAGHPEQFRALNSLANAFSIRFRRRGDDKDLDETIPLLRRALDLVPIGHPDRFRSLGNLASALSTRFGRQGNDEDLNEAVPLHREVLDLLSVSHLDRPRALNDLAGTLSVRFWRHGDGNDLDEAILLLRRALDLLPVSHPDRFWSLSNLARALSTSFEHRGNDKDLNEAIPLHREVLDLMLVDHPERFRSLNSLADALSTRFRRRGDGNDLDEAIPLLRKALDLLPTGHPDRFIPLGNLARALSTRFERRGNNEDLDEAIPLHREVFDLLSVDHPERFLSLNNLARTLSVRFNRHGDGNDLDEAIPLLRKALDSLPAGHPDRFKQLGTLAFVLSTRFEHRGNDEDINEGIALHREALDLHPIGHPEWFMSLGYLAIALSSRFQYRGNDKDLNEGIKLHKQVLDLLPVGHPVRFQSLDNLALALSTRFKLDHKSNDKDLDEAILLHGEALDSLPVGHPEQFRFLGNLANALSVRFWHRRNHEDLDEAMSLYRQTLDVHPMGHPSRYESFNVLAIALSARFWQRGTDDHALDEAIPPRSWIFNNLVNVLSNSFVPHQGDDHDLDEALANANSALSLLTKHDPRQSVVQVTLATIHLLFHQSRRRCTGEDVDSLDAAMGHFKAGVDLVSGGLLSRLQVSLLWIRHADQYNHPTLLEAYATSIQLLDAYMSATASVSSRHHDMKFFPATLAVDAASCALQCAEVCRAVELLEQGRTLIWTQIARFRTPLDNLQERDDHAQTLVKKFQELSSRLDKPPAELPEGTPRVEVEAQAARYSRLIDDWSKTVEEIRKLEGFSRFLLPPLFSDLQDAARDGPIIVLLASKSSCNAIIIPHKHSPVSVRLATSLEKLERLTITLQRTVKREVGPQEKQTKLMEVLRDLWVDVVCPVVENLGTFTKPGSRIWWCPTTFFNFLPLHAAGEYRRGGQNLSKLYISSYTPSLNALTRARTGRSRDRSQSVPFAAIGQNHPTGFEIALESVEPELELVRRLLPPAPTVSFTKVTSVESTKSRALSTLRDNFWLHFACHGTQNFDEPFRSAFHMLDQPLTLLDITQTELSQHEFAFLSACETAVGDMKTPDEVIHLAAGLQFAGVKSVIGTFWSVDDSTVQRLVEAFYTKFCGDKKMNSKRAAKALHLAVQSLANNEDISLEQRIVFMHIGL